jgi:putative DNA primase/helicase
LNRSVFVATGNQLRVEGELPRRTIRCRLIPNCPFPEARKFDFNPVERARERFPKLVAGTLTALRYFLQAGCPTPTYAQGAPLESGKFEAWNRIVRGMLLNLEFADVMRTQREVRLENPMFQQDTYLVLALYEDFKNEKFSAGRIIKEGKATKELLTDGEGKLLSNPDIGYRLRDLKDRVLAGVQVVRVDNYGHVNNYQIVGTPKEEDMDELF